MLTFDFHIYTQHTSFIGMDDYLLCELHLRLELKTVVSHLVGTENCIPFFPLQF